MKFGSHHRCVVICDTAHSEKVDGSVLEIKVNYCRNTRYMLVEEVHSSTKGELYESNRDVVSMAKIKTD